MKASIRGRWDLIKKWLCLNIERWRVQEEKKEVTTEDVIEYVHANGFLGGRKWDEFVDDIPEGWIIDMKEK